MFLGNVVIQTSPVGACLRVRQRHAASDSIWRIVAPRPMPSTMPDEMLKLIRKNVMKVFIVLSLFLYLKFGRNFVSLHKLIFSDSSRLFEGHMLSKFFSRHEVSLVSIFLTPDEYSFW